MIRPRTAMAFHHNVPGPGQYTPNKDPVIPRPPSAVAGKEVRKGFERSKGIPGPGAYSSVVEFNLGPAFSFGTGKFSLRENDVPGPGAYKIPTTIADLPNYAISDKSNEFKYV